MFAPSLGLFKRLHHWNWEQIPFAVWMHMKVTADDELVLLNDEPRPWMINSPGVCGDDEDCKEEIIFTFIGVSVGILLLWGCCRWVRNLLTFLFNLLSWLSSPPPRHTHTVCWRDNRMLLYLFFYSCATSTINR